MVQVLVLPCDPVADPVTVVEPLPLFTLEDVALPVPPLGPVALPVVLLTCKVPALTVMPPTNELLPVSVTEYLLFAARSIVALVVAFVRAASEIDPTVVFVVMS